MKPNYYFAMVGLMLSGPLDLLLFYATNARWQHARNYLSILICAFVFFCVGGLLGKLLARRFPEKFSQIRPLVYCATVGLFVGEFALNPFTWMVAFDTYTPLTNGPKLLNEIVNFLNLRNFLVLSLMVFICSTLIGLMIERSH